MIAVDRDVQIAREYAGKRLRLSGVEVEKVRTLVWSGRMRRLIGTPVNRRFSCVFRAALCSAPGVWNDMVISWTGGALWIDSNGRTTGRSCRCREARA
jgi:hypothetical protein